MDTLATHQRLARLYYRMARVEQIVIHESMVREHTTRWRDRIRVIAEAAISDAPEGSAPIERLEAEIESIEVAFRNILRYLERMQDDADGRVASTIDQQANGALGRCNTGNWSPKP